MNTSPGGWNQRVLSALVLILAIALVGHWAYILLRPLIPFIVTGILSLLVFSIIFQRRRW